MIVRVLRSNDEPDEQKSLLSNTSTGKSSFTRKSGSSYTYTDESFKFKINSKRSRSSVRRSDVISVSEKSNQTQADSNSYSKIAPSTNKTNSQAYEESSDRSEKTQESLREFNEKEGKTQNSESSILLSSKLKDTIVSIVKPTRKIKKRQKNNKNRKTNRKEDADSKSLLKSTAANVPNTAS